MTARKTSAPKPLTTKELAAQPVFGDGPAPDRGGAFIRQADGTLVRDSDTDQAQPDDETAGAAIEPAASDAAPELAPPPADEPATDTKEA